MKTQRLEAFSDGVLAIIITIMVLELKIPHGGDISALRPMVPVFLAYVLSFVFVGIYWNNHHHLFHAAQEVDGAVLWANLALLFFLSLVPVVTAWVGGQPGAPWPAAMYGAVLLLVALAFTLLEKVLIRKNGPRSLLARAVKQSWKEGVSLLICTVGIGVAFVLPWVAEVLYALSALPWIIPDRRIEQRMNAR